MENKFLLSVNGMDLVLNKIHPIDGYVQIRLLTNKTSDKKMRNWCEHQFPINKLKVAIRKHLNAIHIGSLNSRIDWSKLHLRSSFNCWTGEHYDWRIRFNLLEREGN